jgi:hypothetical protein
MALAKIAQTPLAVPKNQGRRHGIPPHQQPEQNIVPAVFIFGGDSSRIKAASPPFVLHSTLVG